MNLIAGFECGLLPWNGHDLLVSSDHLPHTSMQKHYADAIAQGAKIARDGLVPGHDVRARLWVAPDIPVIWDMVHYHWPEDPVHHAEEVSTELFVSGRTNDRLIAVNEPSCHVVHGRSVDDAVQLGIEMMRVASIYVGSRFATCDPIHNTHDEGFHATDRLVAEGHVSLIGINYYAHHAADDLHVILRHAAERYGLPVFVAETGWHEGHPGNVRFPHLSSRLDWWNHVKREVEQSGVEVEGICWYPWLDPVPWDDLHSTDRWPSGWHGFAE